MSIPPIGQRTKSRPALGAPPAFVGIDKYDESTTAAIQALERGDATEIQQQRALDWIIQIACATYQTTFVPGDPGSSHFLQGRQFAGQLIVKQLIVKRSTVAKATGGEIDREQR